MPDPRLVNDAHQRALAPTLLQDQSGLRRLPSRHLVLNAFGVTDRGQVRETNEDHFVIATLAGALWIHQSSMSQTRVHCAEPTGHLLIVADGMGGHAGGEEASRLAIRTVEDFVLRALGWVSRMDEPESVILEELKHALRDADAKVTAEARANPSLRAMGTTLTLAYAIGSQLYVAHAGDSRCYLLRDSALRQITRDHTLVRGPLDAGVIKPADAKTNQFRHIVTNVIGGPAEGIEAEVHRLDLQPSDVVVLTTDGLHDAVSDEEIAAVLCAAPVPERACNELLRRANATGGRDNITVVVARFDGPPSE